jgi:hypothetical protein
MGTRFPPLNLGSKFLARLDPVHVVGAFAAFDVLWIRI